MYLTENRITSTYRGDSIFKGLPRLSSVELPASVTVVGNEAFRNCGSLTLVRIPDSVKIIGDYAFSNCTALTRVLFSSTRKVVSSTAIVPTSLPARGRVESQGIPAVPRSTCAVFLVFVIAKPRNETVKQLPAGRRRSRANYDSF